MKRKDAMRPYHQRVLLLFKDDSESSRIERHLEAWGWEVVSPGSNADLIITDHSAPSVDHAATYPPSVLGIFDAQTVSPSAGELHSFDLLLPAGIHEVALLSSIQLLLEKRRLFKQLEVAQQLSQIGKVTTGLLHALKGPIHNVLMSAEKLDAIKSSLSISPRWIDILARNSELIRDSVDHLLQGFQEGRHPIPVDIVESLNRAIIYSIESSSTDHNITVEKSIEIAQAMVLAPPGHLLHLLLNLLTNAREAIGTRPGIIRTSVRLADSNNVIVEIADTGPGIPQTVIDRLGEPFVTTKPGGTGLGLSLILRIVRDCGGQIEADSPKEGGSRFVLRLPLAPTTDP